ncbi:MAG: hypothetical protein Q9227_001835 [Pyrenula ochraceoflavens]
MSVSQAHRAAAALSEDSSRIKDPVSNFLLDIDELDDIKLDWTNKSIEVKANFHPNTVTVTNARFKRVIATRHFPGRGYEARLEFQPERGNRGPAVVHEWKQIEPMQNGEGSLPTWWDTKYGLFRAYNMKNTTGGHQCPIGITTATGYVPSFGGKSVIPAETLVEGYSRSEKGVSGFLLDANERVSDFILDADKHISGFHDDIDQLKDIKLDRETKDKKIKANFRPNSRSLPPWVELPSWLEEGRI